MFLCVLSLLTFHRSPTARANSSSPATTLPAITPTGTSPFTPGLLMVTTTWTARGQETRRVSPLIWHQTTHSYFFPLSVQSAEVLPEAAWGQWPAGRGLRSRRPRRRSARWSGRRPIGTGSESIIESTAWISATREMEMKADKTTSSKKHNALLNTFTERNVPLQILDFTFTK